MNVRYSVFFKVLTREPQYVKWGYTRDSFYKGGGYLWGSKKGIVDQRGTLRKTGRAMSSSSGCPQVLWHPGVSVNPPRRRRGRDGRAKGSSLGRRSRSPPTSRAPPSLLDGSVPAPPPGVAVREIERTADRKAEGTVRQAPWVGPPRRATAARAPGVRSVGRPGIPPGEPAPAAGVWPAPPLTS